MILNDTNQHQSLVVDGDQKGNRFQINVDAPPLKKEFKQGKTDY